MRARGALLVAVLAACGSSRHELELVGNTGSVGAGSHVVQVVLGDVVDVTGTRIDESFTVVSSDSPRTTYETLGDIEVSCRGEAGTRCDVDGTRVVPHDAGTYDVTASTSRARETWTLVVVDAVGIEISPCGELAVDATSDLDGGVAMVTPLLVVRTRAGKQVAALGARINDRPIEDSSFYQLRATTTPATYTLRGTYRRFSAACRVTIVARPTQP